MSLLHCKGTINVFVFTTEDTNLLKTYSTLCHAHADCAVLSL